MSGVDVAELTGSVPPVRSEATTASRWAAREPFVAAVALVGIAAALVPRSLIGGATLPQSRILLAGVLVFGGLLLVPRLAWQAVHGRFGADHLAGISIVASAVLGEYLAGAIVVLMLSGGETLQQFAVKRATAALRALATRVPTLAHRHHGDGLEDVAVADIRVGDELAILPGEVCPVDGEVVSGRGAMDESYLTGSPSRSRRDQARRSCPAPSTVTRLFAYVQPDSLLTRVSRRSCTSCGMPSSDVRDSAASATKSERGIRPSHS